MRRLLALFAVAAVPGSALAYDLPSPLDLEICWQSICTGVTFRSVPVVTYPLLAPDSGVLMNSGGTVGGYGFDPISGDLAFDTVFAPGASFSGTVDADRCVEGEAFSAGTYSFLGDFQTVNGCNPVVPPAPSPQTIDAVYSYSAVSAGFRIGVEAQRVHHELDPQSGHFTNEEGWAGDYTVSGSSIELFFVDEYTASAGYAAIWDGTTGTNGLVCPTNSQGGGDILNVAGTPEWKHTACPIGLPDVDVRVSTNNPSRHRLTVGPTLGGARNSGLLSHTPYIIAYGIQGQAGTTVLPECPDLELPLAGGGELARARTRWASAPSQGNIVMEVPAALLNADVELILVDTAACAASSPVAARL